MADIAEIEEYINEACTDCDKLMKHIHTRFGDGFYYDLHYFEFVMKMVKAFSDKFNPGPKHNPEDELYNHESRELDKKILRLTIANFSEFKEVFKRYSAQRIETDPSLGDGWINFSDFILKSDGKI